MSKLWRQEQAFASALGYKNIMEEESGENRSSFAGSILMLITVRWSKKLL